MKIVRSIGRAADKAVHGKILKSVAELGRIGNEVAGSNVIAAAFPTTMIPGNVLAGAVSGGKKGALASAHKVLDNPVAKGLYTGMGVVFPPIAPATAGMVAAMEGSSRLLDGLESKDPKQIASAALSLAMTAKNAGAGIPGSQRAIAGIHQVEKMRELLHQADSGVPEAVKAVSRVLAGEKSSDRSQQLAASLLKAIAARKVLKGHAPPPKPGARAPSKILHDQEPDLLSMVHTALTTPAGVRIGDFSVLKTGRLLHKGKNLRRTHR
jgi:hypothetical protein